MTHCSTKMAYMPQASSTRPPVNIAPVALNGNRVLLEPLTQQHLPELAQIAFEPTISRWTTAASIRRRPADLLQIALGEIKAGTAVAWATQFEMRLAKSRDRRASTKSLKSTVLWKLGGTWLGPGLSTAPASTSRRNTCSSTHAFERMNALRVSLETHHENLKVADRNRRAGGKVRGRLPQPHDHAQRQHPPQLLVQHHPRRVA